MDLLKLVIDPLHNFTDYKVLVHEKEEESLEKAVIREESESWHVLEDHLCKSPEELSFAEHVFISLS